MDNIACLKIGYLPLTETFIYEQFKNIKKFNVIVICAKKLNVDIFPMQDIRCLSDLNITNYIYNGVLLKYSKYCPFFAKIIRTGSVKLIHAPFGTDGLHALSYKKRFNIPLVTDFRGYDIGRLPKKNPRMYDELFKTGDVFLVRSNDMRKDMINLGCPGEKIKIHHSSIDLAKFPFREKIASPENGRINILLVGRLTEKKGVPYAIDAFKKVSELHKNIHFTIVGDGPLKSSLQKHIRLSGLQEKIHLLGSLPQKEVIKTMLKSHIFILPSITASDGDKEGIPNVLTEAMATGLPVISTKHGGIPELIEDGRNGFLVEERNVDLLADRLGHLIEHPELWSVFGREGRKKVEEEFNIEKQTEKLEKIYESLIYK